MFGLSRDFVQHGGTFMVVTKKSGLATKDLNQVQSGMMMGNRIPGLLNMKIREVDFEAELHYDISGMRMLSQVWKSTDISMSFFYRVLYQVADALHNCSQYMLDMRKFILHEDYLFISGTGARETVSLTYVPLQQLMYDGLIGNQYKQLVIRLMTRLGALQGDGVQRIFKLCDQELFDPGRLKELLLGLTSYEPELDSKSIRHPGIAASKESEISQMLPIRENSTFKNQRDKSEYGDDPQQVIRHSLNQDNKSGNDFFLSKNREGHQEGIFGKREDREEELYEEDGDQESPLIKYKAYIALGGLLASAVVWRYIYLDDPGTLRFIISSSLTVLLIILVILGWTGRLGLGVGRPGKHLYNYSDSEPALESGELDPLGPSLQESTRFQVEKLTGFMQGLSQRDTQASRSGAEESWRWNFPDQDTHHTSNSHQKYVPQQNLSEREQPMQSHENKVVPGSPSGNERFQAQISSPYPDRDGEHGDAAYYKSLQDVNEMLEKPEQQPTILLQSESITSTTPHVPQAYLERQQEGTDQKQRIQLHAGSFLIGREKERVQYVEPTTGVSRSHVELSPTSEGNGHIVKDLASTNGTVLNGGPMVPYKEYELKDKDEMRIAGVTYTYYAGV